ncbi:hypothetical protein LCGC14_1329890 [marine sediment metagenome]|uniref:Glycosyltransferase family 9 protein n=1 Tax=marine sediment metagenome TaxID=412755 RepID=A0A0F9MXS8_9ZZZZ
MEYLLTDAKDEYAEWLVKSENVLKTGKHKFILKNHQPPGDILMLSACVRDIKRWHSSLSIDVDTSTSDIWDNNPYLTSLNEDDDDTSCIDMEYEIIHESGENVDRHFIHGFIHDFSRKTGYLVKLTEFKPDIYLTDEEKENPVFEDQPEDFVVVVAGGKTDYKTKWWWKEAWIETVNCCPDITFIQVGKTDESSHVHDKIKTNNCINKLGKTSTRELLRLVYQSKGTLSVVTSLMHMAAAFDRHAAVVAGGHEPWWWEKYPGHNYFHTIGRLDCCRYDGCWSGECKNKNDRGRQKCLELISPVEVASAIKEWF